MTTRTQGTKREAEMTPEGGSSEKRCFYYNETKVEEAFDVMYPALQMCLDYTVATPRGVYGGRQAAAFVQACLGQANWIGDPVQALFKVGKELPESNRVCFVQWYLDSYHMWRYITPLLSSKHVDDDGQIETDFYELEELEMAVYVLEVMLNEDFSVDAESDEELAKRYKEIFQEIIDKYKITVRDDSDEEEYSSDEEEEEEE